MTIIYQVFATDGVTESFPYNIELLGMFSDIVVQWVPDGENDAITLVEGTDYTHERGVRVHTEGLPTLADGSLRVERYTNRDRLVDYNGGNTLSESNLDNDTNRLTSVDQEIEAGVLDALRRNDAGDAWNAEDLEGKNAAPATEGDSWTTLDQVRALIDGAEIAEVDNAVVFTFIGNDATTEYELTNLKNLSTATVIVHVDGVYQEAGGTANPTRAGSYDVVNPGDGAYPVGGTGWSYVVFDEAPATDARVECKAIRGTISAIVDPGTVGEAQIEDNSITVAKLAHAAEGQIIRMNATDPEWIAPTTAHLSDFDSAVEAKTLDQFAGVAGNIAMGGNRITGLAAAPVNNNDAVPKLWAETNLKLVKNLWYSKPGDIINQSPVQYTGVGFKPDLVFFRATWTNSDDVTYSNCWTCVWAGGQEAITIGGFSAVGGSNVGPFIRLDPAQAPNYLTVTVMDWGNAKSGSGFGLTDINIIAAKVT